MGQEIELRHMRYFLAVANTLHFSKAAAVLGIAQPPLSQQIRQLEKMLGHALFERTTRGVRLTPAGELLQKRAQSTLDKVGDDLEQVRQLGRGEQGTLTIGFSGSAMLTQLPAAIRTFHQRYPKVKLRLREMWTSDQLTALANGTLDLAFLRDGDPTEGIVMRTLSREPYVAVLPQEHPALCDGTLDTRALADDGFVLFSPTMGSLAYQRTVACCEEYGFRPRVVQEAPQWSTVVRLVAAGLGVSLAPACVAGLNAPGTVCVPVRSRARTTIDEGLKAGATNPMAANFAAIVGREMKAERAAS